MEDDVKPQYATLGEFYAATAAEIRKRGWTKGGYERDGRVCMLGGMSYAAGKDREHLYDWPVRPSWVFDEFFLDYRGVATFNDDPNTNRARVLKALDLAAWVFDDTPFDQRG